MESKELETDVGVHLRPGDLKDCQDLPLFGKSLDVGELFINVTEDEKESLTKFSQFEHHHHEMFVEEHVLTSEIDRNWMEVSRWIKYEETLEDEGTRWGKPRIPALNFHAFVNLRRLLEASLLLLDDESRDFETLCSHILENLEKKDLVKKEDLPISQKMLLLKHKHVIDSDRLWEFLEKQRTSIEEEVGVGFLTPQELSGVRKVSRLMRHMSRKSEAGLVLVGNVEELIGLTVAFVRLAEGVYMPQITEVPVRVRFVFVLMGPSVCDLHYMEVGRCMGTLLTNSIFRHIAYQARERRELLVGLNEFLDASILLPHGDWDYELFHLEELHRRHEDIYHRKQMQSLQLSTVEIVSLEVTKDPFKRSGIPFGGLWNDVTLRYHFYWSDIKDGLNLQCLATIIFLYFACVAGAIAFGGVLKNNTQDYIGIPETLLGTAVGGVIYHLFAAQPLMIVATTGPVLVFDESLFHFCIDHGQRSGFLALRFWIGIWMVVIALIVVGAEGSIYARYFTRFTQEIFTVFISIVFIWESFKSSQKAFFQLVTNKNKKTYDSGEFFTDLAIMLGTFGIAWMLRCFNKSCYGTKLIRKLLGNFGVLLSILIMSGLTYCLTPFEPERKNLIISNAIHGLKTTIPNSPERNGGWIVDPLQISTVWILLSIFPALLLFILIFLEASIGELIMSRKEAQMKKGSGFHLDVLLICLINSLMGLLGTTWVSSATVRSVAHLVALTVFSTNYLPGEKPVVIGTKEQRVTGFVMSLLLGLSVLMGSVLKFVPMSVIFGIFFYMGVSALSNIQFADRIFLFFMQVDKYPELPYVKRVKPWKMHSFTLLQLLCVVIIFGLKSTPASLILPIIFVLLIPFRNYFLNRIYTSEELDALDGKSSVSIVKKEPLRVDVTPLSNPIKLEAKEK